MGKSPINSDGLATHSLMIGKKAEKAESTLLRHTLQQTTWVARKASSRANSSPNRKAPCTAGPCTSITRPRPISIAIRRRLPVSLVVDMAIARLPATSGPRYSRRRRLRRRPGRRVVAMLSMMRAATSTTRYPCPPPLPRRRLRLRLRLRRRRACPASAASWRSA